MSGLLSVCTNACLPRPHSLRCPLHTFSAATHASLHRIPGRALPTHAVVHRSVAVHAASTPESLHLHLPLARHVTLACSAGFIGLLLDRTQADKFIMSVSQAVVLAFATALAILSGSLLNVENAQACLICMAVMGFLVIPTALEMAAELAYPFSSGVSAGTLWAGADIAVVVVGVTVDVAFGGDGTSTKRFSDGGRWLLLACYALAALLWWIFPVRCVHPGSTHAGTAGHTYAVPPPADARRWRWRSILAQG